MTSYATLVVQTTATRFSSTLNPKAIPLGTLSISFTYINGAVEACEEERRRPARAANTGFVSNLTAMIL
jgi:hypothetical protein